MKEGQGERGGLSQQIRSCFSEGGSLELVVLADDDTHVIFEATAT